MPTNIPVRREDRARPSFAIVLVHTLLAAVMIAAVATTVIWAYS